jgi:acyl carrier protein
MAGSIRYEASSIQEFVMGEISAYGVEVGNVTPEATLEELGLDSLDVVELSQSVKKKLGILVAPKDFADTKTLSDALRVIYGRAGLE